MLETTANKFRSALKAHVDDCLERHEVLKVKRRNGEDFVVIGDSDWRAIEETLYLNQVNGMVKSIHDSAQESLDEGTKLEDIDW